MLDFSQLRAAVGSHMRDSTMRRFAGCDPESKSLLYSISQYTRAQAVAEVRYRIKNNLPLTGW